MTKDLNILDISDLHIGHNRIDPFTIHEDLTSLVYPELPNVDLFISNGDFFDHQLKLDSAGSRVSLEVVDTLIDYARRYKIKLRFLKGTFSHDRHQHNILEYRDVSDVDVKFINTVSLEYIEDLDLKILYIPDNLPYKNKFECLDDIKQMMLDRSWDAIDLVIGHGYFEHTLPKGIPHLPHCTFEYHDFKNIVNGYVLMGHVHTPSIYKNIIYCGSFQRLAHGEEEKKGYFKIYRKGSPGAYSWTHEFKENIHSIPFITQSFFEEDLDLCIKSMKEFVLDKFGNNPHGYYRIEHAKSDIKQLLVSIAVKTYPNLVITSKLSKKYEQKSIDVSNIQVCELVAPTPDNIPKLLLDFITEKKGDTKLNLELINQYLEF